MLKASPNSSGFYQCAYDEQLHWLSVLQRRNHDHQSSWLMLSHQMHLCVPVLSLLWYGSRLLMILLMPNS
jgi:hypothetical protein